MQSHVRAVPLKLQAIVDYIVTHFTRLPRVKLFTQFSSKKPSPVFGLGARNSFA